MDKQYLIPNKLVEELVSVSRDDRKNALESIANYLGNNINFELQQANIEETIVVNLPLLVRNLIRSTKYNENIDEILSLMQKILIRHDLIRIITKDISISRLRKELTKICLNINEVNRDHRLLKVAKIEEQLNAYEDRIKRDFHNSSSLISFDSPTSDILLSSTKSNDESEMKFWQELNGLNLDHFNGITAELMSSTSIEDFEQLLPHVLSLVDDFPPEFFHQTPCVLENLIKHLPKITTENTIELFKIMGYLMQSMQKRWMESKKYELNNNNDCMAVQRLVSAIETVLVHYIEYFVDQSFFSATHNLDLLNVLFELLLTLSEYASTTRNICPKITNILLNKLGELTRSMRHCSDSKKEKFTSCRLIYVSCIFVLNVLVASTPRESNSDDNDQASNLWEQELDIALLDGPMQFTNPKIYKLLVENRRHIVEIDEHLKIFIYCDVKFKPVVQVLQNHNTMSDEEIIEIGEKALGTLRIHRSLTIVELLMERINKIYKISTIDPLTRKSSENIYLHLLSVDIIEIRRIAYENVKSHMVNFLQSNNGSLSSFSGADFLGFPITPEIIAEILCFGYFDQDQEVARLAKVILYALLRSNTFHKEYQEILPIMKPVLELSSCLHTNGRNDEKMLTFAFDILQENPLFTEAELYFSIARFLYVGSENIREMAKMRLLKYLEFDEEDIINIVPNDFCILNQKLVRTISIPQNTNFNEGEYETISQLLKTVDRTDEDILKPLLLQFDVLMNSRIFCQKSHDDHLWAYFVGYLDWSHSNNNLIRQITINALLHWSLVVPEFRSYLANETRILRFLIETLIQFNDDEKLKTKTSSLMFMLLFNNFVVTTEKSISMPRIVSNLKFPYKFEKHWNESPYSTITEIEEIMESMQMCDVAGKQEFIKIFKNYFKFSFNKEWFGWKNGKEIDNFNVTDAANIPEMLKLDEDAIQLIKLSACEKIARKLGENLDNTTTFDEALKVIHQIENTIILPQEQSSAEIFNKKLSRFMFYRNSPEQLQVLSHILKTYRNIVQFLSDETAVEFAKHNFFTIVLKTPEKIEEKLFAEVMKTVLVFVKKCKTSEKLVKLLPNNFMEDLMKIVVTQIFENVMRNDRWYDAKQKIHVKPLLFLLRHMLNLVKFPNEFITEMFNKFVDVIPLVYKNHFEHIRNPSNIYLHSGIMTNIFDILLKLASILGAQDINFDKWRTEIFKDLYFWSSKENSTVKYYPWLIIAELTIKRSNFDSFTKNFQETVKVSFVQATLDCLISQRKHLLSHKEQTAIVIIIGHIIDHSPKNISINMMSRIIDQMTHSRNTSSLCHIVRKLILNNTEGLVDLMKNRELIKYLLEYQQINIVDDEKLENLSERFETVSICYKHKPLMEHVADVITHQMKNQYIFLFHDRSKPRDTIHRKFDTMVINLVLVLIQCEVGVIKFSNFLDIPQIIDRFLFFSYEMLIGTGKFSNIIHILNFWNQLIDASNKFDAHAMNLISTHILNVRLHETMLQTSSCDEDGGKIVENYIPQAHYAIDLLFLQVVSVFNSNMKVSKENKQEVDILCFAILRKLTTTNENLRRLSKSVKLHQIVYEKLSLSLGVMQNHRHHNVSSTKGVSKAQVIIKDVCIFTKCMLEWNLPLTENSRLVKKVFLDYLRVSDWLEADSMLMNGFFQLLIKAVSLDIGHICCVQPYEGKPLVQAICMRTQALSLKSPHSDTSLSLINNGIAVMIKCSQFIDIRQILKSVRVIKVLETLQVHLAGKTKNKSPWEGIAVSWLQLLDCLSKFEDTECVPNDVSILCRLIQFGNSKIRKICLSIVKNLSSFKAVGLVLLNSEHFKQTITDFLSVEGTANTNKEAATEKIYVLQTLLTIVNNNESHKAKLKASSLYRKIKDYVTMVKSKPKSHQNTEDSLIAQLADSLFETLYK